MPIKPYFENTALGDPRFQELLITVVTGSALILYAIKMTIDATRPMAGMPIDGRGMFLGLIVPPIAATGGVLLGRAVLRSVNVPGNPRLVRLLIHVGFPVITIVPCYGSILFFSGWDVSNKLSTYRLWFAIALLIGVLSWVVSEFRR